MVQWKFVCGVAALLAVEIINGESIKNDKSETSTTIVPLDATFPGYGAILNENSLAATNTMGPAFNDTPSYAPGQLHPAPTRRRRLEATKSTDMKKLEDFFKQELETDITKLAPKCKREPVPWPGSYWATYVDSINYIYNKGQPSAAEKYATAFGYDVKTLMDKISLLKGVDSMAKRKNCTATAQCKELKDGSVCAKRKGRKEGHCIPKWYGICHAWAPAAILEAEPQCRVERNGTIFEPYDIKALITLAYDGSNIPTVFTGTRFTGNDNAPNNTDEYGRFVDARRRDISPAFFHIAITNIMCRFNQSFIIDISAGNEVWNQPAHSYEVLQMFWLTPRAAAQKYFNRDTYPFNDEATNIAVVTTRFRWVVEAGENGPLVSTGIVDKKYTTYSDLTYILETDDKYHILGGEWIHNCTKFHPDFMWFPTGKPDINTITPVGLVYSEIESLLIESSRGDCKPISSKPPTTDRTTSAEPSTSDRTTLAVVPATEGTTPAVPPALDGTTLAVVPPTTSIPPVVAPPTTITPPAMAPATTTTLPAVAPVTTITPPAVPANPALTGNPVVPPTTALTETPPAVAPNAALTGNMPAQPVATSPLAVTPPPKTLADVTTLPA